MTGRLLKSDAMVQAQVRHHAPAAAGREDRIAKLEGEIERLRTQVAKQSKTIDAFDQQLQQAFSSGRAEGIKVGREDVGSDDAARLAALKLGIEHGLSELRAQLSGIDPLAAGLALDVLQKMFAHPGDSAALVVQLVERQARELDRGAVLQVQVSSADFPGRDPLSELLHVDGLGGVEIETTDRLMSGACVLKLRLGHIATGLDQQWPALRAVIERMAAGE